MNCEEKVARLLAASPGKLTAIVERVRHECDANAVAVFLKSPDTTRILAAAPAAAVGDEYWGDCMNDCLTVSGTGLPLARRWPQRDGGPLHMIICPVESSAQNTVGAIAIGRALAFAAEDVDFCRLLGIELGDGFRAALSLRDDVDQPGERRYLA